MRILILMKIRGHLSVMGRGVTHHDPGGGNATLLMCGKQTEVSKGGKRDAGQGQLSRNPDEKEWWPGASWQPWRGSEMIRF